MKTIAKGIIIGLANIIPGVSGGTLAVILGLYDQIIFAINNIFTKQAFLKAFRLLTKVGFGMLIGIILFSKLIEYLLSTYYQATMFFFLGLIIGSIPLIYKQHTTSEISFKKGICLCIGLLFVLSTYFLPAIKATGSEFNPTSLSCFLPLFISGFLAAIAMIIPGISGSFLLMLLGTYHLILKAISSLNVPILFIVAIGAVLGIVVTAKFIKYCLTKYPEYTYYFILGLIIASIFRIWPGIQLNLSALISLLTLILGVSMNKLLSLLSNHQLK
jgi:putative membrane protein